MLHCLISLSLSLHVLCFWNAGINAWREIEKVRARPFARMYVSSVSERNKKINVKMGVGQLLCQLLSKLKSQFLFKGITVLYATHQKLL